MFNKSNYRQLQLKTIMGVHALVASYWECCESFELKAGY